MQPCTILTGPDQRAEHSTPDADSGALLPRRSRRGRSYRRADDASAAQITPTAVAASALLAWCATRAQQAGAAANGLRRWLSAAERAVL